MANLCEVEMKVKCKKIEDVKAFISMLDHTHNKVEVGRGMFDIGYTDLDEGDTYSIVYGWTKWSVGSSLISDAVRINEFKHNSHSINYDFYPNIEPWGGVYNNKINISISDAAILNDLEIELFSFEPGCNISEHMIIEPSSNIITYECRDDYYELDKESIEYLCDTDGIIFDELVAYYSNVRSDFDISHFKSALKRKYNAELDDAIIKDIVTDDCYSFCVGGFLCPGTDVFEYTI